MRLAWRPTPDRLAPRLATASTGAVTGSGTGVAGAPVPPPGLTRLEAVADLGTGRRRFTRVADALLRWDLHREAGMVVATSSASVEVSVDIVNAGPFGPVAVLAPCRVVATVEEADRRGFVYASLPGHPLAGEELFAVELGPGDEARFRIRSFSRAVGAAGLVPPLTRAGQRLVNRRYLAAARRLAR